VGELVKGPQRRAAEVLREYAEMIEESEIHRSGPMKGKCQPEVQEEIDEYLALAAALEASPDDDFSRAMREHTVEECASLAECANPHDGRDHAECPFCSIAKSIRALKGATP
jgi:DNA-binding GntR family transcriptional regulator